MGPVGQAMVDASALAEGPKGPMFNHCKCTAEALQGLSWVVLVPEAGASSCSCTEAFYCLFNQLL